MTWWQALPALLAAIALLFIPGFVLSRGLGAKGFASIAFAPLASCGLVGVAGIVGGLTGIPWSVLLLAGITALAAAAGWGLHRAFRSRLAPVLPSSGSRFLSWITVSVVLISAAILVEKVLLPAIDSPDSFAQVYDNVFHLNAIRYILNTGNASTLTLGNMLTDTSGLKLYPSVWHSLSALIVQLTSVNVFGAENALTLAVTAVVWPFSCIALVRGVLGPKLVATAVTGVLAVSFWVFPYQTIQWGPLFPNTLAYTVLPIAVLIAASLFGLTKERLANNFTLFSMLAVGICAMFLTQPNGFSALLAFTVPMASGFWLKSFLRATRSKAWRRSTLMVVGCGIAAALLFLVVWRALLLGYDDWNPTRTFWDAINDVITGGLLGRNFTLLASILAALGLLTVVIKRRGGWIVGCLIVAGGLYVTAAWAPLGPFRHFVTGSWYQDPYRLAALVPLFTIVLAAVGSDGAASIVVGIARKLAPSRQASQLKFIHSPSAAMRNIGGVLALGLVLGVFIPLSLDANQKGMRAVSKKISQSWSFDPGWIVSPPEYELMKRLAQEVPSDAVIAVDPYNGGSLAFAISGRQVTQFHLNPSPDMDLAKIAQDLDTAARGSETCELAKKENIQYVLDFGSFYMLDVDSAKLYPGFVEIRDSPTLQLVDQQDHAKLYKVVGC